MSDPLPPKTPDPKNGPQPGTDNGFPSDTLEHLKMIQNVIDRLAGNSFSLKGWSLALTAGLVAFLAKSGGEQRAWILGIAVLIPITCFWLLDAYYLRLERQYRDLFEAVRLNALYKLGALDAFSMNPNDARRYQQARLDHRRGSAEGKDEAEDTNRKPEPPEIRDSLAIEESLWFVACRPAVYRFHGALLLAAATAIAAVYFLSIPESTGEKSGQNSATTTQSDQAEGTAAPQNISVQSNSPSTSDGQGTDAMPSETHSAESSPLLEASPPPQTPPPQPPPP